MIQSGMNALKGRTFISELCEQSLMQIDDYKIYFEIDIPYRINIINN